MYPASSRRCRGTIGRALARWAEKYVGSSSNGGQIVYVTGALAGSDTIATYHAQHIASFSL